ncbi:hypothetical protein GGX14DRAFT_414563 [Mycena pura]|uniref:Nuclear GTPase SLIP-GC n=1 Tax=Mycena pura TaxID=153505 RepID=A0AAD7E4T8_9AGAR|nr:hypothetical protein GGX14DRAFT_414563 [Mycena pura]
MSHYKENMGNNPSQSVKLEPTEYRIAGAFNPSASINLKAESVKAEPVELARNALRPSLKSEATESTNATGAKKQEEDVQMEDVPPTADHYTPEATPQPPAYTIYQSVEEMQYTTELALQEGLKMIEAIGSGIDALELGPLRKEVWNRDITSLRAQGVPSTLIAICGGTGAGKSSTLNAILDDNIVPTSGMRACTAVVTEISYHQKKTIDADIDFLSEKEWKAELEILLGDLVDEDGTVKRTVDLKSDAGVAWQKVHAVYPTVSQEKLVTMTADQIIGKDPKIAKILGATKKIVAKDSKSFGIEIAKYIDSKDQKRGKDKTKDKSKDKDRDPNAPALWPLIRQVNVRCSSPALATGAILVDLPGTGDANAARNSIAKEYMKKSNCIWILAPIHRAVDSKIAKDLLGDAFRTQLMMDGSYDDHTITFIATKCDDISCSEVIQNLRLDEDPELDDIQEKIHRNADEMSECKKKREEFHKVAKSIENELSVLRELKQEQEDHLDAVKDGKPFVPRLTAKKTKQGKPKADKTKKRKNTRGGKKGSPKRRRSGSDWFLDDDEDELKSSVEDGSDASDSDASSASGSDSDGAKDSDNDEDSDDEPESDREKDFDVESVAEMEEEVTEESLERDIAETKKLITDGRQRLNDARKHRKEAVDSLANLKKKASDMQKEKNAFCARKRSEFSKDVLKEDFRTGLKDLDDAAAEERDPDNFDPSVALRDYEAIDLPVFCCSSRDYVRIKKQVKGDGDPTCFTNVQDTGIPDLQEWCHHLTKSTREHAARKFLTQLAAFAKDVKQYVFGVGGVTLGDREMLREKWESGEQPAQAPDVEEDPFAAILGGGRGLYTMPETVPKADRYGNPVGVTPRLVKEFGKIIETSVSSLKDHLRNGLEERCRAGAANAADAAVSTSDDFASSMHWASYRATLRRNGEYRRDLNVELVSPFTRNIAQTWHHVFEADVFSSLLSSITACIDSLINDVEKSAAPGLKDRTKLQGENCLESARVALKQTVETVKDTLHTEQKEVSRSLAPRVKEQLLDGYSRAMYETGKGSVARQKASFRSYIVDCKGHIFEDGADVMLDKLDSAAEAVGETLTAAMDNLAQKVENNLAVLWESVRDNPKQVAARSRLVTEVDRVLEQVQLFAVAAAEKVRADV